MEAATLTAALIEGWRARSESPAPALRPVRPLDEAAYTAIRARIAEDPGARHRLLDWAAVAGMTVPAFCRAFRARTGLPPHRFLLEERVHRAEGMLALPRSDIDLIAEALGFDSRSHFTRVFTLLRGRSPRQ